MITTEQAHMKMVAELVKSPADIRESLTPYKCDLIHATLGISGEAGELLDAVKKHVIYGKDLDYNNMLEELGDIEFYLEQMRQALGVRRIEILQINIDKLRKRYGQKYTDQAAAERKDKE